MARYRYLYPRWIVAVYTLAVVVLSPWTLHLASSLPDTHLAENWALAWIGLNFCMIVLFILTVYFVWQRKVWMVLTAAPLATLLLVDCWFDVLTAEPGREQLLAFALGLFVEIPMAIITFHLAFRAIDELHKKVDSK